MPIQNTQEAIQPKDSCTSHAQRVLSNDNSPDRVGTESYIPVKSGKSESNIENIFGIQKYPKTKARRQLEHRPTKYPKRLNLSSRSDVLNKCSIRKLRRHFWALFKDNCSSRAFRLDRLSFAKVFKAMKILLAKNYDKEIFDDDMCMYIIGITKLTHVKNLEANPKIKYNVSEFLEC